MNKSAVAALGVVLVAAASFGGYWFGQNSATLSPSGAGGAQSAKVGPGAGGGKGEGRGPGGGSGGGVPIPVVEVAKVAMAPMPKAITAVGSLRSDESVILRPEVSGRIAAIQFEEGQRVAKGATLVRLDPAVNQAEVQQARANHSLARTKHQRAIELQQRGFVSAQARDEAENNLKVAEAALALAEAKLAKTELRAPFAGVIGLRSVSVGDYVKEGQDLVNLESIDPLKVDFRVPEVFVKDVKVGQTLEAAVDAMPDKVFQGRLYAINPQVDAAGRSFVIRAVVRNPDTALRPGMFARIRLITQAVDHALVVPEQALLPQGSEQYVYKVLDGKAVRTLVEVGQRRDGRAEIVNGLTADDVVVTAGHLRLRDGIAVRVGNGTGNGGPANAQAPAPSKREARPSATKSGIDPEERARTA